jgi:hypothetical protein
MLRFCKASHRDTPCYLIELNGHRFGISYETIVAYWGPLGACKRVNIWGPTTGRHLSELRANHLPEVTKEQMEALICRATEPPKALFEED